MVTAVILATALLTHNGDAWPPPVVVDAVEHNTTYYWTYDEWRGQWRPDEVSRPDNRMETGSGRRVAC
ncbi:MAG: hypothetical protein KatS3mg038_2281 [Candidatus Kapaibacterium sp.]|nr:MAG: hypothetical protein KatS3mg038_2281 [Candidatus Kapabacteria bacterium]